MLKWSLIDQKGVKYGRQQPPCFFDGPCLRQGDSTKNGQLVAAGVDLQPRNRRVMGKEILPLVQLGAGGSFPILKASGQAVAGGYGFRQDVSHNFPITGHCLSWSRAQSE